MATVKFNYLNHHGKTAERTVDVDGLEFQPNPGFGYQPGWFLSGFCHDKQARRSFAITRILLPDTVLASGVLKSFRLKL